MRKLKTMLIALLCAVTTVVTLGAVSSFTAKADEQTSDYVYQDASVTGIEKANDTRLGFVVAGSDYLGVSQYNNGKDYTNINGLNTLQKIKIDGEAIADEAWDGTNTDPYINLWTRASFVFQQSAFAAATEITVEAGCEFPSYALWSGEGNVVYRTTETITFKKSGSAWVTYKEADVIAILKASDTRFGFVVSGSDYEGQSNYNNGKNYTNISGLNTFTKIKVDGAAIENVYDGDVTDPYLNLWTKAPSYVFQQSAFATATEILIEAGCEFPSYALWSGEGSTIYTTTKDVTFIKIGNAWTVYVDANVIAIEKASDTRLGFVVSGSDYEGQSNYNNGKNYTTISGLNTFAKIKVNGEDIENVYDGEVTDPYLNLWTPSPSYVFQQSAFATATEILIEAGCEFPSFGLWDNSGSVVYKTTEAVTFRKVGGAWYRVYTATFLNENGEKIGENTFTVADGELKYPDYEKEVGYDYAWTGNEIKAENITVTLTKTIKTFDVVIGDADAVKYNYGTTIQKPATDPEKAADAEYTYTFAGWFNGEEEWDFENDTVTDNVTLTAHFDKTAIIYTLIYKNYRGTETTVEFTTLTRAAKLAELKALLHENDEQFIYENNFPDELPLENGKVYEEKRTIRKYTVVIGDNDPVQVEYGSLITRPGGLSSKCNKNFSRRFPIKTFARSIIDHINDRV